VVPDARKDSRFSDNPLVTGKPPMLFYAGFPLKGPKGHRLGALCLIDHRPREFSKKNYQNLQDLAAMAETEIGVERINQTHRRLLLERDQLRTQALVDSLTRLWKSWIWKKTALNETTWLLGLFWQTLTTSKK
jgi:GAF domain-containing protein